MLGGVSVDNYTQLERGNLTRASESVLNALARGLQRHFGLRGHFALATSINP
jgi:hypothetical protein